MAGKKAKPGDESENKLSELELTLTVLWNCVRRWMSQRNNSSVVTGLSDLDVFLLHMLVYRNKQLRGMDLAFALSIDDMHLVSYSLNYIAVAGNVLACVLGAIGIARIIALVDPNGGKPTAPEVIPMLESNLAQVPSRVLSPAGRARVAERQAELAQFLKQLRRESDDLQAL